jgi:hypothetical protein
MDPNNNKNNDGTLDVKTVATMLYSTFVEMTTPFMRTTIGSVIGLIVVTKLNLFAFWPFSILTNLVSEVLAFMGVFVGTVSVLWVITVNLGGAGGGETTTTTINNNNNKKKKSVDNNKKIVVSSTKKRREGSVSPTKKRKLTGTTGNVPKMTTMMMDVPQLYDCPLDMPSRLSSPSTCNTFHHNNMHQEETVVVNNATKTTTATTTPTPTATKKKRKYTSAQMKAMREIARKARDDGLLGR